MDRLRTPFFIVAVVLWLIVVLIEASSLVFLRDAVSAELEAPGIGIAMLCWMDGIVFFTLVMMLLAVFVPGNILGAVQGIVTFIVMLVTVIGGLIALFAAVALLILMITLLAAVPFGTIAYMATYAQFADGPAAVTLGVVLSLKLFAVLFVFLAQQKFILVKGFVFLLLSSFLVSLVVSFLHGLTPGFLDSIADAIAAIIIGVIALIWTIVKLIGAIPGAIKGLRLDRHVS